MSGLLDDEELQRIYQWVDEVPLSRPKRNIARDFADGVLVAEIVSHYFPRLVELHNYSAANSYAQKIYNWNTLNTKVFRKLGFTAQKQELDELCNCHAQAAEKLLKQLQIKMAKYGARKAAAGEDAAAPTGGGSPPYEDAAAAARPAFDGQGGARAAGARAAARAAAAPRAAAPPPSQQEGLRELLAEKDQSIQELRETVDILEIKISKLEQLVRLKDSKIATLQAKLQAE